MMDVDNVNDPSFWHTHEGTIQTVAVVAGVVAIIITAIICYTIWRIKQR